MMADGNSTSSFQQGKTKSLRPGAHSHYTKMATALDNVNKELGNRIGAIRINLDQLETDAMELFDKVVLFVRHGEGEHNVFASEYYKANPDTTVSAYAHPDAPHDPSLTTIGKLEASQAGKELNQILRQLSHDETVTVLSSSLRRTLMTTTEALKELSEDQLAKLKTPIATELCREKYGVNICDMRDPVSKLKQEFPDVSFDLLDYDEDPQSGSRPRETSAELAMRANDFLLSLQDIPSKYVLVFTHSAFLSTMLYLTLEDAAPDLSISKEEEEDRRGEDAKALDAILPKNYPHSKLGGWFTTGELRMYGLVYPR